MSWSGFVFMYTIIILGLLIGMCNRIVLVEYLYALCSLMMALPTCGDFSTESDSA